MDEIVIVGAVRTPVGKRNGWLRDVHPVKLGAHVLAEALKRAGLEGGQVDHVLMGCVDQPPALAPHATATPTRLFSQTAKWSTRSTASTASSASSGRK